MLRFDHPPSIGTVILLDEQPFELSRTQPHIRLDGQRTTLLVWQTECAGCGDTIEVASPMKTNGLSRRCPSCRKPGKPVKGKRGRKVQIKVIPA